MRKKIISLILAGTMVLTMVPGMALADTGDAGGTGTDVEQPAAGTQFKDTIIMEGNDAAVKYAPTLVAVNTEAGVEKGQVTKENFGENDVKDFTKLEVTFTPGELFADDNSNYRMTITNDDEDKTDVEGLQLIYQNGEYNHWWDISTAGFGPAQGATISELLGDKDSMKQAIYAVSNNPGKEYKLSLNLVKVNNGTTEVAQADEENGIIDSYDFTLKTANPFEEGFKDTIIMEGKDAAVKYAPTLVAVNTEAGVNKGQVTEQNFNAEGLTELNVKFTPGDLFKDDNSNYRMTITNNDEDKTAVEGLQLIYQNGPNSHWWDISTAGFGPAQGATISELLGDADSMEQAIYAVSDKAGADYDLSLNLVKVGTGADRIIGSHTFKLKTENPGEKAVAKVGKEYYDSLNAAINAAAGSDNDATEVELLQETATLTETAEINSSIKIKGAANGTAIAYEKTEDPDEPEAAAATLKAVTEATAADNDCAIVVGTGAKLILQGVKFQGITCENSPVIGLNGGTVEIAGQVKFANNEADAAIAPLATADDDEAAGTVEVANEAVLDAADAAVAGKITADGTIKAKALTLGADSAINAGAAVSAETVTVSATADNQAKVSGSLTADKIVAAEGTANDAQIFVIEDGAIVAVPDAQSADFLANNTTATAGVIAQGDTATVYGTITTAPDLSSLIGVNKVIIDENASFDGNAGNMVVPDNASVTNNSGNEITVETSDNKETTVGAGETEVAKPEETVNPNPPSGGGSTPAPAKPEISTGDGYTAALSTDGTKATITVADGYVLKDVLVNGVSKGAVTTVENLKTGDKVEIVVEKKAQPEDPNAELKAGIQATTITADSKTAKGYIYLSWEKSGNYDVDGYQIYRQDTKDGEFQPYAKTQKTTFGNTAKLKKGNTYSYKIRGYKTVDGEEIWTKESNVTSKKLTQTHAEYLKKGVQNTKISIYSKSAKGSVTITWKKQAGFKVDGYQVYRSDKKTTGFKKMTSRTTMKYKNTKGLKKGKKYYYKVRGYRTVDGKTVYTKWSKTIYRTAK